MNINEQIRDIAKKRNLDENNFGLFITKRFPNETDLSYIDTWADRFATGKPEVFMDNHSLKVWAEILGCSFDTAKKIQKSIK